MRIRSGAPLRVIVDALDAAGWGEELDGEPKGVLSMIKALAQMLPKSGRGFGTVEQLARRAGYGVRWSSVCLGRAEELGILTHWHRGTVVDGVPRPSFFTVNKTLLVALLAVARDAADAAAEERRREFALKRAATPWFSKWGRKTRRSGRPAVATTLSPYGEGSGAPRAAWTPDPAPIGDLLVGMSLVRAAFADAPKIDGYASDRVTLRKPGLMHGVRPAGA